MGGKNVEKFSECGVNHGYESQSKLRCINPSAARDNSTSSSNFIPICGIRFQRVSLELEFQQRRTKKQCQLLKQCQAQNQPNKRFGFLS
jgi:hypothetical protein